MQLDELKGETTMVQATPLFHVNGHSASDTMTGVQCANCNAWLGKERAVASSPGGTKFFCKQDPEDVQEGRIDSCYLQWRRRHH